MYKKYRFYFGFYKSCDATTDDIHHTKCTNPSSIILSKGRKACCFHQSSIFKQPKANNQSHPLANPLKRVYYQWLNNEPQFNYSAPTKDRPNKDFTPKFSPILCGPIFLYTTH